MPERLPPYYSLEELIGMIDEPNRSACLNILTDNRELIEIAQGSSYNHQAWAGGFREHTEEVMNIGLVTYNLWNSLRPLPFSLSSFITAAFLHDIEKPWKYNFNADGSIRYKTELDTKMSHHQFRLQVINKYGVVLSDEEENAIRYAEGEGNDYSRTKRVQGPLAAFVHDCDTASARIWPDYPLKENDPWKGDISRNYGRKQ